MSLKARLLVGLIASLTIVLTVGCLGLYWFQRELLQRDFDLRLEQRSSLAFQGLFSRSPSSSNDANFGKQPPPGLVFAALMDSRTHRVERVSPAGADIQWVHAALPDLVGESAFLTVTSPKGVQVRILMRRPRDERLNDGPHRPRHEGQGPPPFPDGPPREPRFDDADRGDGAPPDEGLHNFPEDRLLAEDDRIPPGDQVFIAGANLAPLQGMLKQCVWILLIAEMSGVLIVAGVVILVVQRGLRPLRSLEMEIRTIDDTDLARRISTAELPGELRPIVGQLNDLLLRLEDAFAGERTFTASAAHEFRTPLAGIRTQLDVCLRRPRSCEEYQAVLTQCLTALISLQRMVDTLLDLARLDAGVIRPASQSVDVAGLVRSQWQRVESQASSRGCSVDINMPDSLEFSTDPVLLEHIVSNLLGNAAEYADSSGTIRIFAGRNGGKLRLTIANPAVSLTPGDAANMFDRFWRKDAVRTNTGQHCGLGLSVAERYAGILGGQVHAVLRDGQLEVVVELPALPQR